MSIDTAALIDECYVVVKSATQNKGDGQFSIIAKHLKTLCNEHADSAVPWRFLARIHQDAAMADVQGDEYAAEAHNTIKKLKASLEYSLRALQNDTHSLSCALLAGCTLVQWQALSLVLSTYVHQQLPAPQSCDFQLVLQAVSRALQPGSEAVQTTSANTREQRLAVQLPSSYDPAGNYKLPLGMARRHRHPDKRQDGQADFPPLATRVEQVLSLLGELSKTFEDFPENKRGRLLAGELYRLLMHSMDGQPWLHPILVCYEGMLQDLKNLAYDHGSKRRWDPPEASALPPPGALGFHAGPNGAETLPVQGGMAGIAKPAPPPGPPPNRSQQQEQRNGQVPCSGQHAQPRAVLIDVQKASWHCLRCNVLNHISSIKAAACSNCNERLCMDHVKKHCTGQYNKRRCVLMHLHVDDSLRGMPSTLTSVNRSMTHDVSDMLAHFVVWKRDLKRQQPAAVSKVVTMTKVSSKNTVVGDKVQKEQPDTQTVSSTDASEANSGPNGTAAPVRNAWASGKASTLLQPQTQTSTAVTVAAVRSGSVKAPKSPPTRMVAPGSGTYPSRGPSKVPGPPSTAQLAQADTSQRGLQSLGTAPRSSNATASTAAQTAVEVQVPEPGSSQGPWQELAASTEPNKDGSGTKDDQLAAVQQEQQVKKKRNRKNKQNSSNAALTGEVASVASDSSSSTAVAVRSTSPASIADPKRMEVVASKTLTVSAALDKRQDKGPPPGFPARVASLAGVPSQEQVIAGVGLPSHQDACGLVDFDQDDLQRAMAPATQLAMPLQQDTAATAEFSAVHHVPVLSTSMQTEHSMVAAGQVWGHPAADAGPDIAVGVPSFVCSAIPLEAASLIAAGAKQGGFWQPDSVQGLTPPQQQHYQVSQLQLQMQQAAVDTDSQLPSGSGQPVPAGIGIWQPPFLAPAAEPTFGDFLPLPGQGAEGSVGLSTGPQLAQAAPHPALQQELSQVPMQNSLQLDAQRPWSGFGPGPPQGPQQSPAQGPQQSGQQGADQGRVQCSHALVNGGEEGSVQYSHANAVPPLGPADQQSQVLVGGTIISQQPTLPQAEAELKAEVRRELLRMTDGSRLEMNPAVDEQLSRMDIRVWRLLLVGLKAFRARKNNGISPIGEAPLHDFVQADGILSFVELGRSVMTSMGAHSGPVLTSALPATSLAHSVGGPTSVHLHPAGTPGQPGSHVAPSPEVQHTMVAAQQPLSVQQYGANTMDSVTQQHNALQQPLHVLQPAGQAQHPHQLYSWHASPQGHWQQEHQQQFSQSAPQGGWAQQQEQQQVSPPTAVAYSVHHGIPPQQQQQQGFGSQVPLPHASAAVEPITQHQPQRAAPPPLPAPLGMVTAADPTAMLTYGSDPANQLPHPASDGALGWESRTFSSDSASTVRAPGPPPCPPMPVLPVSSTHAPTLPPVPSHHSPPTAAYALRTSAVEAPAGTAGSPKAPLPPQPRRQQPAMPVPVPLQQGPPGVQGPSHQWAVRPHEGAPSAGPSMPVPVSTARAPMLPYPGPPMVPSVRPTAHRPAVGNGTASSEGDKGAGAGAANSWATKLSGRSAAATKQPLDPNQPLLLVSNGGAVDGSAPGGLGLVNNEGEYNCFLNVVLQSLLMLIEFRHLILRGKFRDTLSGDKEGRVVLALQQVLKVLVTGQRKLKNAAKAGDVLPAISVDPAPLREALAEASSASFGSGEMGDAQEVFACIIECVETAITRHRDDSAIGSVSSTKNPFGLHFKEVMQCSQCQRESRHMDYVNVTQLLPVARMVRPRSQPAASAWSLAHAIRLYVNDTHSHRSCDRDAGGCGSLQPTRVSLQGAPAIYTVTCVWDTTNASADEVNAVLEVIPMELPLSEAYEGVPEDANSTDAHKLKCIICYYGSHYNAIIRDKRERRSQRTGVTFSVYDDTSVRPLGNWQAIRRYALAGRLQPLLLIYQKMSDLDADE